MTQSLISNRLVQSVLHISDSIARKLIRQKATIMVAESATGGLIQHFLTEIPGSSKFFLGGIVAYSNELKNRFLQVPQSTLKSYGAVSAETVAAMASGIRLWMNSHYGLATSGIAGPTGGTKKKPIGLFYVAVSHFSFETIIQKYEFQGTRSENKLQFCKAGLQCLQEVLSQED